MSALEYMSALALIRAQVEARLADRFPSALSQRPPVELAKQKFEDEYTITHIGHCAACLDDLRQIKQKLAGTGASR